MYETRKQRQSDFDPILCMLLFALLAQGSEYLSTFQQPGAASDELWLQVRSNEVPEPRAVIVLSGMSSIAWNVTAISAHHSIRGNGSSTVDVLLHTRNGCPHYLGLAANERKSVV